MTGHRIKVLKYVSISAIYVPDGCEGIRISYWDSDLDDADELFIYGEGEDTGENYQISFDDVDLDNDLFYKLELVKFA